MKLVCFCNNTAGGLVCDLLNGKDSLVTGYKTNGPEHSYLKLGDTSTVQYTVDNSHWDELVNKHKGTNAWVGTHCHPNGIPNIDSFDKILIITTESRESKLYRWLRYYYGWFCHTYPDWYETDELERIDKVRELAKNVFPPFVSFPGGLNVEFADVVAGKFVSDHGLNKEVFSSWKERNPWLTDHVTYKWGVDRFNEAEWELLHQKPFKYV